MSFLKEAHDKNYREEGKPYELLEGRKHQMNSFNAFMGAWRGIDTPVTSLQHIETADAICYRRPIALMP